MIELNEILEKKERIVRYDFGGIYFLICKSKVVYVGKATYSIEDRLNIHRSRRRMKFDSIYVIKCDTSELNLLEKQYIAKFTPKYNFTDNPAAMNNDRYKCFSIIHNKYKSMNHLSEEIHINATTLRVVMDPTNELDTYQQAIFDNVREFLFNKHYKYTKRNETI